MDRPLPAGVYEVRYNWQHYGDIPCSYKPLDAYDAWTVTATADEDVTHEAFFDPIDRRNGTSVGELALYGHVNRLLWFSDGTPRVEIETDIPLTDKVVEIIAQDGNVAHAFHSTDSTKTGRTLSWPVEDQPWSAGDKLMVRIREAHLRQQAVRWSERWTGGKVHNRRYAIQWPRG